jgi:hypothetical protein
MTSTDTNETGNENDDGVGVANVLCFNDHGDSGQIMETSDNGGYTCPDCGRRAGFSLQWEDPNTE